VTFTSHEVCRLTGCTYRQLDYWVRTGLVFPSVVEARGSGSRRIFSDDDMERVKRIRIASQLTQGTLQDCLDRLDAIVEELATTAA
jgi:DNA-binding transcriptional MerR regulator